MIDAVCRRLARNLQVRRTLPGRGRLHVDRQLPFLCVYRRPSGQPDAGTERLVKGEASYLVAPGARAYRAGLSELVRGVAATLSAEFGAFLIIELWSAPDGGEANDPAVPTVAPQFTIHAPAAATMTSTVEALETGLERIKVLKQRVAVAVVRDGKGRPPGMPRLLTEAVAQELGCAVVGVEVPPVYREPHSTTEFPLVVRALRRSLGLALRQAFFEFARSRTTHRPPHYHALGRRAVVKAVWEVDRRLAAVSNQFDYLLYLTPVNANDAWRRFQRRRFERAPAFHYRPLAVDPSALKRRLYRIPIDRVEDPALQRLFREKQEELELKLTMLRDRDTRRFRYESLQLFGDVKEDLFQLAETLLSSLSPRGSSPGEGKVDATAFAHRVETEFDVYRQACSGFQARAEVSDEVSGLVVSSGTLWIPADLCLAPARVEALLAHEVGTHLVTYFNGKMQPFQQLYAGLAGYEELQEGIAVLAEYLAGGLSSGRMRQLAARVVAVRHMLDGASFVDTFRVLDRDYGFTQRSAYTTTMRVYRAGGLTKDAVYLRGLVAILRHVEKGGDLHRLLVGKLAIEHIPIIRELQYRKVLAAAPIVPRYLQAPAARDRLEQLRGSSASVLTLVSGATARRPSRR